MAFLPPYCNYTAGFPGTLKSPEIYQSYLSRYGPAWSHMHHYCFALTEIGAIDRRKTSATEKTTLINSAIANIDYVLERTKPGFAFRAEALSRKARLLLRRKSIEPAKETAKQLVDEWPTVPDGYVIMADILTQEGRHNEAKQILVIGDEKITDKERYTKMRNALNLK